VAIAKLCAFGNPTEPSQSTKRLQTNTTYWTGPIENT
jgi:hypothetical protein